jgi:hypothetical protein
LQQLASYINCGARRYYVHCAYTVSGGDAAAAAPRYRMLEFASGVAYRAAVANNDTRRIVDELAAADAVDTVTLTQRYAIGYASQKVVPILAAINGGGSAYATLAIHVDDAQPPKRAKHE